MDLYTKDGETVASLPGRREPIAATLQRRCTARYESGRWATHQEATISLGSDPRSRRSVTRDQDCDETNCLDANSGV